MDINKSILASGDSQNQGETINSTEYNGSIRTKQVDKYGFFGGIQYTDPDKSLSKASLESIRARELKWIDLIRNWDRSMSKQFSKIKERCRKGIPDSLRSKAWQLLSGSYVSLSSSQCRFNDYLLLDGDKACVMDISKDVNRQYPHHELFIDERGQGQEDLFSLLKAYSVHQPEVGYCQAQAPLAALLLTIMPLEQAFWCFTATCDSYLPGYYEKGLEAVQIDSLVLMALIKKACPIAYNHLKSLKVDPLLWMVDWFMCVYARTLPWPTLLRVWDMFYCEGAKVLFLVAVAIVKAVLGTKEQVQTAGGFYETLDRLKKLPAELLSEEVFIPKILKVSFSGSEMEREHRRQAKRWRQMRSGDAGKKTSLASLFPWKSKASATTATAAYGGGRGGDEEGRGRVDKSTEMGRGDHGVEEAESAGDLMEGSNCHDSLQDGGATDAIKKTKRYAPIKRASIKKLFSAPRKSPTAPPSYPSPVQQHNASTDTTIDFISSLMNCKKELSFVSEAGAAADDNDVIAVAALADNVTKVLSGDDYDIVKGARVVGNGVASVQKMMGNDVLNKVGVDEDDSLVKVDEENVGKIPGDDGEGYNVVKVDDDKKYVKKKDDNERKSDVKKGDDDDVVIDNDEACVDYEKKPNDDDDDDDDTNKPLKENISDVKGADDDADDKVEMEEEFRWGVVYSKEMISDDNLIDHHHQHQQQAFDDEVTGDADNDDSVHANVSRDNIICGSSHDDNDIVRGVADNDTVRGVADNNTRRSVVTDGKEEQEALVTNEALIEMVYNVANTYGMLYNAAAAAKGGDDDDGAAADDDVGGKADIGGGDHDPKGNDEIKESMSNAEERDGDNGVVRIVGEGGDGDDDDDAAKEADDDEDNAAKEADDDCGNDDDDVNKGVNNSTRNSSATLIAQECVIPQHGGGGDEGDDEEDGREDGALLRDDDDSFLHDKTDFELTDTSVNTVIHNPTPCYTATITPTNFNNNNNNPDEIHVAKDDDDCGDDVNDDDDEELKKDDRDVNDYYEALKNDNYDNDDDDKEEDKRDGYMMERKINCGEEKRDDNDDSNDADDDHRILSFADRDDDDNDGHFDHIDDGVACEEKEEYDGVVCNGDDDDDVRGHDEDGDDAISDKSDDDVAGYDDYRVNDDEDDDKEDDSRQGDGF